MPTDSRLLSRRNLLRAGVSLPIALGLGAAGAFALALTPERADADDTQTPSVMEGPYFKAASPERAAIRETDTKGTPLLLTGRVRVWQRRGRGCATRRRCWFAPTALRLRHGPAR